MKFIDQDGLTYFWKRISEIINQRIYDAQVKGLHNCATYGAPFTGKPNCEYCGRGFFIDFSMYKEDE